MDKIIGVLKPKGPTSHDIINQIRKITGERRVGHAGTLDPLASGVLVVGIGREATKKLGGIVKKEKEYMATIKLGVTSTTDDEEGEKKISNFQFPISNNEIKKVLTEFVGNIKQTPPIYSAIKIKGKPAHRRVRKGEDVRLESRIVEIKEIEILDYKWPILKLRVVTGPGVYIRSLARDIGDKLKTGGYLAELERIRVGEFTKESAVKVEDIAPLELHDHQ